jgi:hypothetical protein
MPDPVLTRYGLGTKNNRTKFQMLCIRPVSTAVISGLPEIFAVGSERERNVRVWGGVKRCTFHNPVEEVFSSLPLS